jgi:hypothetical protein
MRLVVSLTTLPGRYRKLYRTLRSINSQSLKADAVYLGLPKIAKRLNLPYPRLSKKLSDLCTVVSLDQDYGPICKILGALNSETDPNTIIVTIDDDIVYPFNFLEEFAERAQKYPKSAIGSTGLLVGHNIFNYSSVSALTPDWNRVTGFLVPAEGRPVDILCGVSGIAYRRKFFPETPEEMLSYALEHQSLFINDDVLISCYLSYLGVERRVFVDLPFIDQKTIFNPKIDAKDGNEISFSRLNFIGQFHEAVNKARDVGLLTTTAPSTLEDSTALRIIICILLVAIIVLCIWLLFRRRAQ